ncbi:MAG: DDE-type integrase/transposase/recombinase [Euryarchaeota archaeon]|nr:DDE-type integrase/transposase/recombinase [Euryarchaeota archaeon]
MTKLNDTKIRFICRQISAGTMSCRQAAVLYGVSVRRVQQLICQYRQGGEPPKLSKGRRPKAPPLTNDERKLIDTYWERYRFGSRHLFNLMRSEGVQIPHHKVRAHLVQTGRVLDSPNKQKKRSRCRYEREHSFSLIHGDWHRTSEEHPHVILWQDDASRMILAGGEYPERSMEHSIDTLKQAMEVARSFNSFICEVNTDRGSEFFSNHPKDEKRTRNNAVSKNGFQLFLEANGVRHVVSRVNNPQTNGKLERLWLEYDRHRWRFASLAEFIDWYNGRMHGGLCWEIAETPAMAMQRKLRPECIIGLFWRCVEC